MRSEILLTIFILIATGCATSGYKPIPAQAVNPTSESPKDLGVDASTITKFHVFDDLTFKRFQTETTSSKSIQAKADAVRQILCDGRRPKVKPPEFLVTLVLPKGDPKDTVETISRNQKEFVKLERMYLKRWLIMDASKPSLINKMVNDDFANFKNNVVDTGYERRQANNRIAVLIPFVTSQSHKKVAEYYSSLRLTAALPQLQLEPQLWHPSKYFIAIADQRERKILLSIKAADFVKTAIGQINYGTESTTEILKHQQLKPDTLIQYITDDESHTIRNHALYSISPNVWKLEDGTSLQPLQMTVVEDIGFLRQNYAWRIPKEFA